MEHSGSGDNVKQEQAPAAVINLVVSDQQGTEVHFKVKPHTKIEKVINAYCQKKAVDANQVRFLFDGARVLPNQTPAELGMEDGDKIDCVVEQIGGAC